MDSRDWEILLELYTTQNITKAAENLYISQPALTYRLKHMEKEFHTTIVYRGKKGVEFTPQGKVIVEYARQMLLQMRKTKEKVVNMNGDIRGTLRLGASSNYARYELPALLKKFVSFHPQVEINLITGWSSKIIQHLYREEVHIGILRNEFNWQEEKILLKEEPICVVSKIPLEINHLPQVPRINYHTDYSLKNMIDQWWQSNFQVPPLVGMEVDRIDTCKELVLNGLGYAIFPKICLNDQDSLFTLPLRMKNKPLIRRTWMIYRKESLELSIVNAFVKFMAKHYGNKQNNEKIQCRQ